MSTLEKNIKTIQNKLSSLKPGSRAYTMYSDRLEKKVNQYMRFKKMRTRYESLEKLENLDNDYIITIHNKSAFNL